MVQSPASRRLPGPSPRRLLVFLSSVCAPLLCSVVAHLQVLHSQECGLQVGRVMLGHPSVMAIPRSPLPQPEHRHAAPHAGGLPVSSEEKTQSGEHME